MTNEELVVELKKSLGIQQESTAFDGVLMQKIRAVIGFMKNAGVSDEALSSDSAVGAIMVGAADLWSQESGTVKFSPVFISMTAQLTY
jgi:hypothetical protein